MERNPKLRDGLNVSRFSKRCHGRIDENPSVLPRAYFRKRWSTREAWQSPARRWKPSTRRPVSVVASPHAYIRQDPDAAALVVSFGEQWYRIHYHAVSPSLLKVGAACIRLGRQRGRQAAAGRARGSRVDGCDCARGR